MPDEKFYSWEYNGRPVAPTFPEEPPADPDLIVDEATFENYQVAPQPAARAQTGTGKQSRSLLASVVIAVVSICAVLGFCVSSLLPFRYSPDLLDWEAEAGRVYSSADGSGPVGGELGNVVAVAEGVTFDYALLRSGKVAVFDESTNQVIQGLEGVVGLDSDGETVLALKDDGTVWSWGGCSGSQPEQVPVVEGATAIHIDNATMFASAADGTVWGWGRGFQEACGFTPQELPQLKGASDIAYVSHDDVLAVAADGSMQAWALSDLVSGEASEPEVGYSDGLSYLSVVANGEQAIAVDSEGALYLWTGGANCLPQSCTSEMTYVGYAVLVGRHADGFWQLDSVDSLGLSADGFTWEYPSEYGWWGVATLSSGGTYLVGGDEPTLPDNSSDSAPELDDDSAQAVEWAPGIIQINDGGCFGQVVDGSYIATRCELEEGVGVVLTDSDGTLFGGTVVKSDFVLGQQVSIIEPDDEDLELETYDGSDDVEFNAAVAEVLAEYLEG